MVDIDNEFDKVLTLEDQFYQEGYEEGSKENITHNYLEGKQYGLQIGFQRFILVGQMLSLCTVIESQFTSNKALLKSTSSVRELIASIKMDNEEDSVEHYESTVVKLKNKFRIILLSSNRLLKKQQMDPLTYDEVEDLSRIIAGEIKGFVEDEDVTKDFLAQDQSKVW